MLWHAYVSMVVVSVRVLDWGEQESCSGEDAGMNRAAVLDPGFKRLQLHFLRHVHGIR